MRAYGVAIVGIVAAALLSAGAGASAPSPREIAFAGAWHGSGGNVVAVRAVEHTEIRLVSLAGRNLGNLDSYAQHHDEYPRWSPDGRTIVFDRDAALEPNGDDDRLLAGDAHSGRVRQLYANVSRGTQTWRP